MAITDLTEQLRSEAEAHQRNLERIREACRIIRDKCMVPRSQAEDSRYAAQVAHLNSEVAHQRDERKQLLGRIDDLVSADAGNVAELDLKISAATIAVTEASQALRTTADGNQIYRLAASWFGVSTSDVTPGQFAKARFVFATFSAVAVALAGTFASLVYYARSRVQDAPTLLGTLMTKVARARRAYYARKRKPIVREIAGPEIYRDGKGPPIVIEKEVIRWVDRIVLIPRWGIKAPLYVNSFIRRCIGADLKHNQVGNVNTNLMSFQKAN
jgi:hypothetical protein